MPHTNTRSRGPAAAALLILLLACIGLTACGGSSGSASSNAASTGTTSTGTASTGTTSTSTGTSGGTTGPGGRSSGRFTAMRECLQKNGVTLPQRSSGSGRPPGAGGFLGGGAGAQLPKGVTRAQYEAALKKCGGGGHFLRSGPAGVNNPIFKQALAKFAECLRQNGVNVPTPNTSGKGPVFSTKGLNTSSPQFKAATVKCRGALIGAFRRPTGAKP